jgi:hypothetical protein
MSIFPIRQQTGSLQRRRLIKVNLFLQKLITLGVGPNSSCVLSLGPLPRNSTSATVCPQEPVPVNPDGKHTVEDWKFFYNGWDKGVDGNGGQQGATTEGTFPESRKGELYGNLLETLGLTQERMVKGDMLFFHQLLLPLCDPKMSGIADDPRKAFYSQVKTFSNL